MVEIARSLLRNLPKIVKVVTEKRGVLSGLPLNYPVSNVSS